MALQPAAGHGGREGHPLGPEVARRVELDAVGAATSANCPVDLASTLADQAARIDELTTRCTDTTGMLGCLFPPGADPGCLGSAAAQIGTDLSETAFGPN